MPYRVNEPAVVGEVIDGEAIVINLDTGYYYSMEGSASYLWERLVAGADLREIAEALAQVDGAEGSLEIVVQTFVDHLLKEDLIRLEEGAPASDSPAALPIRYAPPKLNVFTDMQSLLLLDPIHQVNDGGWPYPSEHP